MGSSIYFSLLLRILKFDIFCREFSIEIGLIVNLEHCTWRYEICCLWEHLIINFSVFRFDFTIELCLTVEYGVDYVETKYCLCLGP